MKTSISFALLLLLLPGLAQAVICKSVDADGVVSFTDVPAAECPPASRVTDYVRPAPPAERVEQADTGITGREVDFGGYRSIAIGSPEDGGIVRTNEARVSVEVDLDPGLLQSHFITVTLDGKAYRGRYGSSAVELTGVDPGEHKLRAKVIDAKGKTLIDSQTVSFTLLRAPTRIQVDSVNPDPARPGSFNITGVFEGTQVEGSDVLIRLPLIGTEYVGKVDADGTWTIDVGGEPVSEPRYEIKVNTGGLQFSKTQETDPEVFEGRGVVNYRSGPAPDYGPAAPPDYTPRGGGISTTPGQTNPAFRPNFTP